jgi:succinate-acetate transporter protein
MSMWAINSILDYGMFYICLAIIYTTAEQKIYKRKCKSFDVQLLGNKFLYIE